MFRYVFGLVALFFIRGLCPYVDFCMFDKVINMFGQNGRRCSLNVPNFCRVRGSVDHYSQPSTHKGFMLISEPSRYSLVQSANGCS